MDDEAADRVLVVEDDMFIADLVGMGLRHEGFKVSTVVNGQQAIASTARDRPDLIVLDIMLPDVDGFEVCRRLRATGDDVPVLFLTARDAVEDRVCGLDLGADDYLTKPFSVSELVARVRAVLRRRQPAMALPGPRLTYADLVIDQASREVWRATAKVVLTATEFNMLMYLVRNSGRVLSRSQLLDAVWGYDFCGNPGVVETYVSYLRAKLDPLGPPLIHTVRGLGYMLRAPRSGQ